MTTQPTWDADSLRLSYNYGNTGHWFQFSSIIAEARTKYQSLKIVQHDTLGRVLLLDNDIMMSSSYHSYDDAVIELIKNWADTLGVFAPRLDILILGGGDCSLAFELAAYTDVASITVVEIDKEVVDICRKHFPHAERAATHPKVKFVYDDAFKFIAECNPASYDIVIDDMVSDPHEEGTGYYAKLASAFPNTPIISQTDSITSGAHCHILSQIQSFCTSPKVVSKYIPEYMEHWTFTLYSQQSQFTP